MTLTERSTARASAACISALVLALALAVAAAGPAAADPTPAPSNGVDTSTLVSPTSDDALLNLLGEQGVSYQPATTFEEVLATDRQDETLVIDTSEVPDPVALSEFSSVAFSRVIILDDDVNTLEALAPGVSVDQTSVSGPATKLEPSCSQSDALAAGNVDLEEATSTYTLNPGTVGTTCYPVDGAASFVRVHAQTGNGDVIVLGSTAFFENQYLASAGNAAFGLRLFGAHPNLVWWAPNFVSDPSLSNCYGFGCPAGSGGGGGAGDAGGGGGGGGGATAQPQNGTTVTESPGPRQASSNPPTLTSLMPSWIWWALLQLVVAALLTGYWRARRLGRVVSEELPVTVRAAETVEGHARLYRRANAHGRAAELLRRATASRLAGYFGIPAVRAHADPSLLVAPVAARLDTSQELIGDLLAGEVPQSEAELVLLADHLDQLEKEVRSS